MKLTGGFLGNDYRLLQIHFHWDDQVTGTGPGQGNPGAERQGSEHTVQNKQYRGEVHFVHYKNGADLSDLSALGAGLLADIFSRKLKSNRL